MKAALGVASCTRVSMPSRPAITKNTNAVIIVRRPMTVWLTEARRCTPGPVAQIAVSSRCSRSARPGLRRLSGRRAHLFASPAAPAFASAASKSPAGCATTSNRIPE